MSIADAIRRARERMGWSQSELARRIGVSKTAVSKWEEGTTAPNRNRIELVARALGITPDALSPYATTALSSVDLISTGTSIPIMDWSLFVQYQGLIPEAILSNLPRVLADLDGDAVAVALRIEDDPLPGHVSPCDVVIVETAIKPIDGDLVVALAGADIVLRQYQSRGLDSSGASSFDLLSTNPDHPTRTVNSSNPGKVLGVVTEVRKRRR